jgi:CBS domain-containing protein
VLVKFLNPGFSLREQTAASKSVGEKMPLALFRRVAENKSNNNKEEVISMNENKFSENARRRCREIMTRNVKTATREMSLQAVAALMRDGDMGSMPIVEDGKLVGIVTDRDIVVRAVADGRDVSTKIGDVMTSEIFSVKEDDFVFEAIRLMGDKQVRRVPIINEAGELVGIIAMADVALETEDEREIAETLEEISSGAGFWKKG